MRRTTLIIGGIVLAVIFMGFWGFSYTLMNRVTLVAPHCEEREGEGAFTPANFTREDFDFSAYYMPNYETVNIPSREAQITLSAWFIPNQAAEPDQLSPTVIIVHGFSDCKNRPQSLLPAGMLTHHGFNALVIDLREHGDSTVIDGRSALGTEEYLDVLGAWDWLIVEKGIPPEKIGLFGYSTGASSAMIAAGEETRVRAVWADSGFATFEGVIEFQLERNNFPAIFKSSGRFLHQTLTDSTWETPTALEAMFKFNGRPLYIVHGQADETVPVAAANQLGVAYQETNSDGWVEVWLLTETKHIEAMFDETDDYQTRLVDFFMAHLSS